MATREQIALTGVGASLAEFAPMSAARIFLIAGIGLILAGMIFGDVFAVFVLHQNAGRVIDQLTLASQAVAAGNSQGVVEHFVNIGGLLENRGTKVDAHAHMIAFGYLALVLAIVQPYLAFSAVAKRRLAKLFVLGAVMLPVCVFLIHYVGLVYSPLQSIGWASIFADLGGLLVLIACAGEAVGIKQYFSGARTADEEASSDRSWSSRALLSGGTLLILAGFIHGVWYAGAHLYENEDRDARLMTQIVDHASANRMAEVSQDIAAYNLLQGEKAVAIAAHSHVVEFGLLAILLGFVQGYVYLGEKWKRRWAVVLLAGSIILPVCVQAEIKFGLAAGGIADIGGLMVVIALFGMLAGILRYTGRTDAASEAAR